MLLNVIIQDWTGKAFPVMDVKYKKASRAHFSPSLCSCWKNCSNRTRKRSFYLSHSDSWSLNAHNKNKLVWKQIPLCLTFFSAWQFLTAFENAKCLNGRKYFLVVYVTIHNADETMRVAGTRLWWLSRPHSCHRGAGSSCDVLDTSGWRATPTSREHSPQVWDTQRSFLRKQKPETEKMGRMGRASIGVLKGRCHKASMLGWFILDPEL